MKPGIRITALKCIQLFSGLPASSAVKLIVHQASPQLLVPLTNNFIARSQDSSNLGVTWNSTFDRWRLINKFHIQRVRVTELIKL